MEVQYWIVMFVYCFKEFGIVLGDNKMLPHRFHVGYYNCCSTVTEVTELVESVTIQINKKKLNVSNKTLMENNHSDKRLRNSHNIINIISNEIKNFSEADHKLIPINSTDNVQENLNFLLNTQRIKYLNYSLAYKNKGLKNIVNKNVKTYEKFYIKNLEGNAVCDITKGNYLNICGQCVSIPEKENIHIDKCGVCEGKNSCRICSDIPGTFFDNCGQCLKPTSEHWNNCTKIIEIVPQVIDLAVAKINVSVVLKGVGLVQTNLPNIQCTVSAANGNRTVGILDTVVKDEKIIILLNLPDKEGEFLVSCNTSSGESISQQQELYFVNSSLLSVLTVKPTTIKLGYSVEIEMAVRGISSLVDLICFVKDGDYVVAVAPTNKIQGNPLVSNVTCSKYTPKRATAYKIGIVYTYSALNEIQKNSELKEIIVETDAPVIVKGGFTTDLQRIWIEFDKNVDGETLCSALFTKETYQVLGSDPSCSYVGNTLWVMLGKNSIIQSTDEIKIMPDKIRSSHGDNKYAPAFKGTFPLKINKNKFKAQKPMYRLIGANFICPGEKLDPHKFQSSNYNISSDAKRNLSSEVIIRSLDSAYIKYNASLLFQVDNDYMEPNERQRNNLLTWFSVRQLQKSILIQDIMDRIVINNSLLIQHVNYTLSVVGQNRFGDAGDEINMSFYQLKEMNNTNKPLQLLLSGPYQVNPYTEILIETKIIPSCTENHELPYNTKYKWKLESSTSTIDLSSYSGSKLHLPGGTLQPNLKCTIYCHLINKDTNEALLSESFELETLTSPLEVRIGVTNLEIGTGQSLELWVSTNLISTADDKVQFNWICEYNSEKCLAPGPNSTELSEVYKKEFQQKVLKLKPGSLAVGRYTFKVKAVMKDNKSFAVTEPTYITVIPGEHPQIQILKYSIKPLNPNEGLFIPAKIFNLKPGCVMNWEVERENSFDYINLKSLRNIQSNLILSSDSNTKSKEFPLQIPGKDDNNGSLTLKEGASYKISHSVYCGGNRHSSASIVIYTDVLPKPEKLKVQPSEGIALITRFYFSTKRAYAPLQDHPLIYSFGYKLPNESPQFIYTSADWLHTEILMPSGSFKGSEVVTLLKVCNVRQVCIVEIGPTIYTKPPETLSSSALRLLGLEYIRLLSGQEYNEALSTALSSLKTLQTLTDKIAYNNISKQVESAIISEMDAISQDLERKKQMLIKPAVALLDTATTTLQYIPKSDTALSQIVAFKNKILSSLNNEGISDLKMRNSLAGNTDSFSSNLNSSLLKIRIKRRDETFKENAMSYNMIKTLMKASEVAILNLNDSKAVVAETKELLHNMEKYITSLCSQVSEEHEYYIGTKIAIVSVKMITIITTYSEDILIPNCPTNCDMKKAAYVKLNIQLSDSTAFSDNVCFASIIYPSDYLSQIYKPEEKFTDGMRRSDIYYLKLSGNHDFSHDAGVDVKLKIPLKNIEQQLDLKSKLNLQCRTWIESKGWVSNSCITSDVENNNVLCHCPINQYVSVFIVKENKTYVKEFDNEVDEIHQDIPTESKLTTKPDWELIPLTSPNFFFRIDEDYNLIVNDKKEEFETSIKMQLITQLKIPPGMFESLSVLPGSIMVTMQLINTNPVTVNDVLPKLVRALNNGELSLVGINGEKLNVPQQLLQITEKQTGGENNSYIGLIILCSILLLLSIIFVSIFVTSLIVKRSHEKVMSEIQQNLEEPKLPKYRQLYFEESIDGSAKSLSQYQQPRRNGTVNSLSSPQCKEEHDSGIGINGKLEKIQKI